MTRAESAAKARRAKAALEARARQHLDSRRVYDEAAPISDAALERLAVFVKQRPIRLLNPAHYFHYCDYSKWPHTLGNEPYIKVAHRYRDGTVMEWPTYHASDENRKAVFAASSLVSARCRWVRTNTERLNVATRLGIVFG